MRRVVLTMIVVLVLAATGVASGQAGSATITIVKEATPNSSQNFNFTAGPPTPLIGVGNEGGVLSGFILDDAAPSDNDLYPKSRSFVLPNGVYTFGEAPPSNWILKSIECTAGSGSSFVVTLPNVQITLGGGDVTCTFRNELTVTIQTLKYRDSNGNGVRNAGEAALAGWQITASLQPTGTLMYTGTTNSLGRVNFSFIPAGTWEVCEVLQDGWVNTQPGGASPCYTVTLTPGQTVSRNFGNR